MALKEKFKKIKKQTTYLVPNKRRKKIKIYR